MVFFREIKNTNGGVYHPKTLYEMLVAMQMLLNDAGAKISILNYSEFLDVRKHLDEKMKSLPTAGFCRPKIQAAIITEEMEGKNYGLRAF